MKKNVFKHKASVIVRDVRKLTPHLSLLKSNHCEQQPQLRQSPILSPFFKKCVYTEIADSMNFQNHSNLIDDNSTITTIASIFQLNNNQSKTIISMDHSDEVSQQRSSSGNSSSVPRISTEVPIWVIPCYGIIFLFAIVGNLLVISTLIKNRRMRTITNVFLLNLAISDMLLGMLCIPVTLVGTLLRHFIFGEIICKLLQFAQAVSVAVSSWTLVAISCERYYAICHPLRSRAWQTINHAYKIIGFIWLGSILGMLPIAICSELIETSRGLRKCRDKWPSAEAERYFNIYLDLMLLVLPLIILCVAYILITRTLYVSMQQERKATSLSMGNMSTALTTPAAAATTTNTSTTAAATPTTHTTSSFKWHSGLSFKGKNGGRASQRGAEEDAVATSTGTTMNCRQIATDDTPSSTKLIPKSHSFQKRHFGGKQVLQNNEQRLLKCRRGFFSLRTRSNRENEEQEISCNKTPETVLSLDADLKLLQSTEQSTLSRTNSLHSAVSALRRSNEAKNLESKKRVVKMLFVLVMEFFICWTPLYVINTLVLFIGPAAYKYIDYTAIIFLQLLAYSACCCNPITYCFMNASFRRSFLDTFKGLQYCRPVKHRTRYWTKSENHSAAVVHLTNNSPLAIPNSVTIICNETPQL